MSQLFITATLPGTGHGAGERSASVLQALRAIAPTRVLLLRYPWHPEPQPGECDHVIEALPSDANATAYYRRRKLGIGPFRTEPRLVQQLEGILRQEPMQLIVCRYALTLPLDAPRFAPSLIDLDDVPTDRPDLGFRGLRWLGPHLLGRSLRGYRTVFVTKSADVGKVHHTDVRVLPCISTSVRPLHGSATEASLLFLGSRGHPPNDEGMARFIATIWPRVKARLPDALLTLGGTGWEQYATVPGVHVAGYIESLEEAYRLAAVIVCPVWSGAGACVKIAEAAGFGRPIVTTAHAAAGYASILAPAEHLLVAGTDAEFAQHCVALLQDSELRARIGSAAASRAAAMLSPLALEKILRGAIRSLFPAEPSSEPPQTGSRDSAESR